MTTPQAGAYDDIVKTAEKNGIPVATTNSFDGGIFDRLGISHTGQDASAAAIAGEALVQCLIDRGITGGLDHLPERARRWATSKSTTASSSAYNAIVAALKAAGKLDAFKVDAGPENVGVEADPNDPVNAHRLAVRVARRRGRRLRRQQRLHAGACQGGRPDRHDRQDLRLRLRPRPGPAGSPQDAAT